MRGCSAALSCWLAIGVACQGEDWIIAGELPSDMGVSIEERDTPGLPSDPGACPSSLELLEQKGQAFDAASVTASHVGRWRGTLGGDAATGFPSRQVLLGIDASGAGTLLFEAATSARFPADMDAGYLCSIDRASRVVCGSPSGFVGGFAYPIGGVRSRDGVLSFVIGMADPWGSWCAQREPVRWDDPNQACGVAFGVLPEGESVWSELGCTRLLRKGGSEAIDCALMFALDYCQCASDACFARFDRPVEVGLVLSQDGTALGGSLWYENTVEAASIVLNRVP